MNYSELLAIDFRLIGPELALAIATCVIMLIASRRWARMAAPLLALAGLAVSGALALTQLATPATGFADMVTNDGFGTIFKLISVAVAIVTVFLGYRYFVVKQLDKPEYYALLLIATLGMMVMANSSNLIVILIGLEIMSVPLYALAGFNRRSLESNESGIKYFLIGAFATGFTLMGIAFLFGATASTDLRDIVNQFNAYRANAEAYLLLGTALTLVGFAFKIAAVPFHSWVPDVYQGAPTPVTAFFSVGPKAAAFAALIRIFDFGLGEIPGIEVAFGILAILTMTVGNVLAIRQDNIKRMLAYSSIAHAGYILVALAAGGQPAISAAVFYLIAYAVFNLGAFAVLTVLETRSGKRSDYREFAGLSKGHPYLAVALALFMFALSGFPPTVGFFGKYYIFSAVVNEGISANNGFLIALAIIGVLNSFISVYYYLRVVKTSYFDTTDGAYDRAQVSPAVTFVVALMAVGTLGLGIFPEQLLSLTRSAVFVFL